MGRQRFVPGGYYANESGVRQRFIPGRGWIGENSPNAYFETITETLTATSDFGPSQPETLSEILTASFNLDPVVSTVQYFVPGGFHHTDNGARQYFVPGRGWINDTGRTHTDYRASVAFSDAMNESAAASYAISDAFSITAQIVYSATLIDTAPGSPGSSTANSASYGRAAYGRAVYGKSGGFSGGDTAFPGARFDFIDEISESESLGVEFSASFHMTRSFTETLTPTFDITATINGQEWGRDPSGNDILTIGAENRTFTIRDYT